MFGMTKSEIKQDPMIFDCSEEFELGALCSSSTNKFAGVEVVLAFRFGNNKLTDVILLIPEYNQESYFKLFGKISTKFQLLEMEDKKGVFDFVKLGFLNPTEEWDLEKFVSKVEEFESQALLAKYISYKFFEKSILDNLKSNLKKLPKNYTSLLMTSDINTRVLTFIAADESIAITFSVPNRLQRQLFKPDGGDEDF
jgi:predicted sugar kinase